MLSAYRTCLKTSPRFIPAQIDKFLRLMPALHDLLLASTEAE